MKRNGGEVWESARKVRGVGRLRKSKKGIERGWEKKGEGRVE